MLTKALELAAQINHPITAAIFAAVLSLLALIAMSKGKKQPPKIAGGLAAAIFLLGLSPLLANTYLESRGIYHIRIEVLGVDKQPVNDAEITSSAGGEVKKTEAGWEFSIPPQNKPADGIVTFRARKSDDFLAGLTRLELSHDYFPEVVLYLSPMPSSIARGMVEDEFGRPIQGARVWVQGFEETVTTGATGSFHLEAHAADGQQIILIVEKGHETVQSTAIAGKTSEIIMRKSAHSEALR